MFKKLSVCALILFAMTRPALAADDLIVSQSSHGVSATVEKLVTILESKGMTVFGKVDHASNAEKADMTLRPTQLVIFGNPKVGTPLMNCSQSIAIDLPQKMLVWEDEKKVVWLAYNNPEHLKDRHNVSGCDEVFAKVSGALANFAKAATSP